jgi:hypothetical protein
MSDNSENLDLSDKQKQILFNKALKMGLPVTCASCEHMFAAITNGEPRCGKFLCGGPILGRSFSDYKGPIPKERFATICLKCGSPNITHKVIVVGKEQTFALCEIHKSIFDNILISPDNNLTQIPPIIIPLK